MNIFITGATGFIGQALAMKLVSIGHIVHAIYRSENKAKLLQHENIKLFKGDIMDMVSLEKAMNDCQEVYHIAALASVVEMKRGDFVRYKYLVSQLSCLKSTTRQVNQDQFPCNIRQLRSWIALLCLSSLNRVILDGKNPK